MIALACSVIGSILDAITNAREKRQLREAAKTARETKDIVEIIKAASAIKADKICCELSIRSASSGWGGLTQLKITLQDPKIANICFSSKQVFATMHQAQDETIKRGDIIAMHEWGG